MSNTFFADGSPWLTHPLLTTERAAAEVDRVLGWCPDAATVLDLGCGFGRHSIELARRGVQVCGVDPSETMIAEARKRATAAGVTADLRVGPAQGFRLERPVDLALLLFTTLGQDPLDGSDPVDIAADVLRTARANLRPGGILVIEVPDRDRLSETLVTTEQLGPVAVTRVLDADTGRVTERFAGPQHTHDLGYVVFTATELAELVEAAGLVVVAHLDTALAPPPPTFQTLVARCPTG